ncbi:MAG TPA: bacterial transcriptional activator domain-containing protein [Actinomycetota bacterium]|nr:bacterial transcriptional activator domain-containing protein [Actinomycetota bacterium]
MQALKAPYAFRLLGRFRARAESGSWPQIEGRRLQQLVSYLLLFNDRAHRREALSSVLWPDSSPAQARKNLRQSLWLLQRLPARGNEYFPELLVHDREWVSVNPATVWVDVAEVENAFRRVRDVRPELLSAEDAGEIMAAVDVYKGDLLEGWTERWCVDARDRLRGMYATLLEKLVGYCEASHRLDTGLAYADLLLRQDRASERAHWRLMRLYHLAGDRTAALRQFERCRSALQAELGVEPGRLTRQLYEEIRRSG